MQGKIDYRTEALFGLAYFWVYLAYLFANQESEFMHWFTLVIVPFILLYLHQKKRVSNLFLRDVEMKKRAT